VDFEGLSKNMIPLINNGLREYIQKKEVDGKWRINQPKRTKNHYKIRVFLTLIDQFPPHFFGGWGER